MSLNRIVPQAGPEAYKTYQIAAPLATHWRPATCEEVGCEQYANGWRTVVPADSPQAAYIRQDRSRSHQEARTGDGLAEFTFPPGQTCFRPHKARLDREERYLVTGGDWRGNPRQERREHASAADWQEDFAEHQDRINKEISNG